MSRFPLFPHFLFLVSFSCPPHSGGQPQCLSAATTGKRHVLVRRIQEGQARLTNIFFFLSFKGYTCNSIYHCTPSRQTLERRWGRTALSCHRIIQKFLGCTMHHHAWIYKYWPHKHVQCTRLIYTAPIGTHTRRRVSPFFSIEQLVHDVWAINNVFLLLCGGVIACPALTLGDNKSVRHNGFFSRILFYFFFFVALVRVVLCKTGQKGMEKKQRSGATINIDTWHCKRRNFPFRRGIDGQEHA